MTFNIRLETEADGINQWKYRKEHVAQTIAFFDTDIVGMQEAFIGQIKDLEVQLPNFQRVGLGREDGEEAGEFSPIMFNKNKFTLVETQTFWLNEPVTKIGRGWDAAFNRVVTWAKLKRISDKKIFFVFNTHFDHMGQVARRESAKLLLRKVKEIAQNSKAIVLGDFNAKPQDEPIQIITNTQDSLHLINSISISASKHFGPTGTFNGFEAKEKSDEPIDYIFLKGSMKVLKHASISMSWNGLFASDHFAVFSELQF